MDVLPLSGNYSFRLDNALIVDFMTRSAGVLNSHGYLSLETNANLRETLRKTQNLKKHLIPELIKNDVEYLCVLTSRYGYMRLNSNIFRYTLKPSLMKLITTLSNWGNELIPVSKRLFNRSFMLYDGFDSEKRYLYSTVILALAENIEMTCQNLWSAASECNNYFPHSMASLDESDLQLDKELAESLGFRNLNFSPFPQIDNKGIAKLIVRSIEELVELVCEIAFHMNQPNSLSQEPIVQLLCECIRQECRKLLDSDLNVKNHLISGEISRILKLNAMTLIDQNLEKLANQFLIMVDHHQKHSKKSPLAYQSKDMERKITTDLIAKGESVENAHQASKSLLDYLGVYTIQPNEMLTAELSRINHSLTPKSLNLLQEFCSKEDVMGVSLLEKRNALESATKLSKAFTDNLNNVLKLSIFFLCLFLSSCGVKRDPMSELIDLRPEVPFRIQKQNTPPRNSLLLEQKNTGKSSSQKH